MNEHARPPFPKQKQAMPGQTDAMRPQPDHGEESYRGSGKLKGKKAVITGADSGIGRAVALAFAREGADVLIAYLNEHEDAEQTKRLVEEAGQKAVLMAGDIGEPAHCRAIIDKALAELGSVDILVNNAARQGTFDSIEDISDEEWQLTFKTNIRAMFYLTKAAVPHMKEGSAIINTASINADSLSQRRYLELRLPRIVLPVSAMSSPGPDKPPQSLLDLRSALSEINGLHADIRTLSQKRGRMPLARPGNARQTRARDIVENSRPVGSACRPQGTHGIGAKVGRLSLGASFLSETGTLCH